MVYLADCGTTPGCIKRPAPLQRPCPLILSASLPIPKTVDEIITQRRNELMLHNSWSALTAVPDGGGNHSGIESYLLFPLLKVGRGLGQSVALSLAL